MQFPFFRSTFLSLLCVPAATIASAANWADSMFPVKTHDFGAVAVAAKTEFVFPIQNNSGRDVHISNVRASCGCTTPILSEQWIKAGQKGDLTARFNTGSFRGKKGATLTVVIDRPVYAEVQLRVDGYIRQDMVLNPGSVEFGKVTTGEPVERRVAIAYAGRSDWQITGVESPLPFIETQVVEKTRSGQRVDYELVVRMSADAPVGFINNELVVTTNDRSMPRVPVQMGGEVEAALSLAPQTFAIGSLKAGEDFAQRLIVRSSNPFKITKIECAGFEVDFTPTDEAKAAHIVNVRLVAQGNAGDVKSDLIVYTDAGDELTATSTVTGKIIDK